MQIRKNTALILFFSCFFIASAAAENFRVHELHELRLTESVHEASATAGINDALAIFLPEDRTYINGIELVVKIPEIIASWRDTVAYSVYNNIQPQPSHEKIDYGGERAAVSTFPGKLSYTIYIPLASDFSIKESPYHDVLEVMPKSDRNFIFFRMQLAMKGVPESFEAAVFDITAKPVLRDKGMLSLSVLKPQEAADDSRSYSLYIDGEATDSKAAGALLLKTGEHHLSITSEFFRDEVRTFRIEQARATALSISLRDITPTVRIIGFKDAEIFFDGEPFTKTESERPVQPGEHTLRFAIGDYEVNKTISIVNGRSYTINLVIDASVLETD